MRRLHSRRRTRRSGRWGSSVCGWMSFPETRCASSTRSIRCRRRRRPRNAGCTTDRWRTPGSSTRSRHEVDNLKKRRTDREDELLALMEVREELETQERAAAERSESLRARVEEVGGIAADELQRLGTELKERSEARAALAESVDPAVPGALRRTASSEEGGRRRRTDRRCVPGMPRAALVRVRGSAEAESRARRGVNTAGGSWSSDRRLRRGLSREPGSRRHRRGDHDRGRRRSWPRSRGASARRRTTWRSTPR